ncbi:MAG TPA: BolA/IbaG family iron-sulfur metabolism protein [Nitrospiria bacterium]|nr:BolA/IbaG family iron-sulfur metabolism protein [Nitrospiria bacterium]
MITRETLAGYIRKVLPDAEVTVTDKTGMMDHFIVRVVSSQFEGKSLLDRNRLVYQALNEPMSDGRIHAVEIKAEAPAKSGQSA